MEYNKETEETAKKVLDLVNDFGFDPKGGIMNENYCSECADSSRCCEEHDKSCNLQYGCAVCRTEQDYLCPECGQDTGYVNGAGGMTFQCGGPGACRGDKYCVHCGDPLEEPGEEYCPECARFWPGDSGQCQCQDCKRLYTRSSPNQSATECSDCAEYWSRQENK